MRGKNAAVIRSALAICLAGVLLAAGLLVWRAGKEDKSGVSSTVPQEAPLWNLASDNIPSVGEWQRKGDEPVAVSPDGKWIAIAGLDEAVHLLDARGKEKWRYRIPERYGHSLVFSTDSKLVFVGECSMDGAVYGIDAASGKKRWEYPVANDVGRPASSRSVNYRTLDKCCVFDLVATGDTLFVVGTHRDRRFEELPTGARIVNDVLDTVLYAFHPADGKLLWRYPARGTMDTHMPCLLYSRALGQLVGANTSYWRPSMQPEKYQNGSVRLIDARTGLESCSYRIEPTFMSYTGIWYSLSVSPNGRFVSVGTIDGRLILLEVRQGPSLARLWEKNVSTPLTVSGIPIYATSSHSVVFDNGDVFMTSGSTFAKQTTSGVVRQPPNQHPDSNSAFLFSRNGEILWKWKAPGGIADLFHHPGSGLIVLSVENDYVEKSLDAAGFYFLKYTGGQGSLPVERFGSLQLRGISRSGAIAQDGSFFVGVELPVRLTDDTLAGEHKLHIVPLSSMVGEAVVQ